MQIGEHVHKMLARGHPQLTRQCSGTLGTVEHNTIDMAHYVERRVVDLEVGA